MSKWTLGIIGGSGLYEIDGLEDRREEQVETAWGKPSDVLVRGRIGEVELVFLPRHGRGHRITPTEVPYRANIAALKAAGVTDILSISACGSLKEEYAPVTSSPQTSSSTAHLRATKPSSQLAWWRMSPWPTRSARACRGLQQMRRKLSDQRCIAAARIWPWRGRNSLRSQNQSSIGNGVAT